jgi:hypothetical protein
MRSASLFKYGEQTTGLCRGEGSCTSPDSLLGRLSSRTDFGKPCRMLHPTLLLGRPRDFEDAPLALVVVELVVTTASTSADALDVAYVETLDGRGFGACLGKRTNGLTRHCIPSNPSQLQL